MNKITVKKKQFSQRSLEPLAESNKPHNLKPNSIKKFKQKSSFNTELKRITERIGPVLEKNILKFQVANNTSEGLPFKRRARSSSPPRQGLTIGKKEFNLFPCGAPVIPVASRMQIVEEDEELRKIKEDYLKMLENAQETRPTENEDFWDEEEGYIQNIISSLSFVRIAK